MPGVASVIQKHKANLWKDPTAATGKECESEHLDMKNILRLKVSIMKSFSLKLKLRFDSVNLNSCFSFLTFV